MVWNQVVQVAAAEAVIEAAPQTVWKGAVQPVALETARDIGAQMAEEEAVGDEVVRAAAAPVMVWKAAQTVAPDMVRDKVALKAAPEAARDEAAQTTAADKPARDHTALVL